MLNPLSGTCALWTGFQGVSNTTSLLAVVRLMPTDPARVDRRKTLNPEDSLNFLIFEGQASDEGTQP